MESIKEMTWFQSGILLLLVAMVLVFAVVYAITTSQVGYAFRDEILVPGQENGTAVYTGEIQKQHTVITVSNNTVTLKFGNQSYGPYTLREDPTAIPKDVEFAGAVTGLEIRRGEELFFRGAKEITEGSLRLIEDSGSPLTQFFASTDHNTSYTDRYGNTVYSIEPTAHEIVELLDSPELTHKGSWGGWFWGLVICLVTAATVIFAEEIFYFTMSLRVEDAYGLEPSGLTVVSRNIGWALMSILAFAVFMICLQ